MTKYKFKPIPVEKKTSKVDAVQVLSILDIENFRRPEETIGMYTEGPFLEEFFIDPTDKGSIGDYLVRNSRDELFVSRKEEFESLYEVDSA